MHGYLYVNMITTTFGRFGIEQLENEEDHISLGNATYKKF